MTCCIKLMWDYGCWPLWQHDGEIFGNINPASLPLSAAIVARLEAWAAIPDAKLAAVDYPPDMQWSADEARSFEAEGLDLWHCLRRELGCDYYVMYEIDGRMFLPEDEATG